MISQPVFFNTRLPHRLEDRVRLFGRWENYGLVLRIQNSNDSKGIVVPVIPFHMPENPNLFPNLHFIPTQGDSFPALRLLKLISRLVTSGHDHRYVLVVGISPIDMMAGIFLKFFLRRRLVLQGQFHGDVYRFSKKVSYKDFFRTLVSRLLIKCSDSIRVVSEFQVEEISLISGKNVAAFVVAPIPIDPTMIASPPVEKNKKLIAVVGRLHPERGVQEIIDVLSQLCANGIDLEVEIAGDGPLKSDIEKLVNLFPNQITHWGYRDSKFLSELYGRASILLSAAPAEGYGMALREALFNGVHVVAKECKGTSSLKEDFYQQVHVYKSASAAVEILISLLGNMPKAPTGEDSFAKQEKIDFRRTQDLTRSWLH
jgi:glycosyltransferase involved in cell wall biosynthesis